MNESEFEALLRGLPPAKPRAEFTERIAAELDRHAGSQLQCTPAAGLLSRAESKSQGRGWNLWPGLGWALGGAAITMAILLAGSEFRSPDTGLSQPVPEVATIALNEEPDESVAELIATEDEGLVYESVDSEPQRQLRLTYLERHTWTNPESGAVIEFEVPREDVVWMPVAMQ